MLNALVDDGFYVVIRQGIKNGLPFPPGLYQPGIFQGTELVGNGGLGHTQELGNIAHAHLRFKQRIQNAHARRIPEDFEQLKSTIREIDSLFTKEGSRDLSLTDEFDIVFASSDSKKNVEEIRRQPMVAPEKPKNKKHKKY